MEELALLKFSRNRNHLKTRASKQVYFKNYTYGGVIWAKVLGFDRIQGVYISEE